jgi:hypothetical protein
MYRFISSRRGQGDKRVVEIQEGVAYANHQQCAYANHQQCVTHRFCLRSLYIYLQGSSVYHYEFEEFCTFWSIDSVKHGQRASVHMFREEENYFVVCTQFVRYA